MDRKFLAIGAILASFWVTALSYGTSHGGADSPLVAAVKRGDSVAVARLLKVGGDVDAFDGVWNTALIFAARDGKMTIARQLLVGGATVNWQDGELVTPLILASFKNHPDVVELLLAHGADPSI